MIPGYCRPGFESQTMILIFNRNISIFGLGLHKPSVLTRKNFRKFPLSKKLRRLLPSFRDSCDIFRGVFDLVLLGVFDPFSLLDWARDSPSLSDPILDLAL